MAPTRREVPPLVGDALGSATWGRREVAVGYHSVNRHGCGRLFPATHTAGFLVSLAGRQLLGLEELDSDIAYMAWTAVVAAHEPRIMLRSGAEFNFLDPASSPFTIEDIAHSLSMLCRYAGHCREFYSVAEHCLLVSDVVPEHGFAALMHDAAEAFVGDVTRPLKQMLPQYKRIERQVEAAIAARFDVPWPIPEAVKRADLAVLAAEQAQLMPPGTDEWAGSAGISAAPVTVSCLSPRDAKAAFLDRFSKLGGREVRPLVAVA